MGIRYEIEDDGTTIRRNESDARPKEWTAPKSKRLRLHCERRLRQSEQGGRKGSDEQNCASIKTLVPGKRTSSPQFSLMPAVIKSSRSVRDKLRGIQTLKARQMTRFKARVQVIGTRGTPCMAPSAACDDDILGDSDGGALCRDSGWRLTVGGSCSSEGDEPSADRAAFIVAHVPISAQHANTKDHHNSHYASAVARSFIRRSCRSMAARIRHMETSC